MKKYFIRERIVFDCFGNCVRGGFRWSNVKNCKGKTLFFENELECKIHIDFLKSLCKQYEYKIVEKEC